MNLRIFLLLALIGCGVQPNLSSKKEIISTKDAPAAIGPYSQAVKVGNTIYLAGQIAIDPASSKMIDGGIEEQTEQVLKNIEAVLNTSGFTLDNVVQSQVFITDLNNYSALNGVYANYFKENRPARAVVEVSRLPKDALVEIMVTAVK